MDEGALEAAISAYAAQLQQVDSVLSAGLDPTQQSDLLKLKEDLTQLIELTEASLVSVKKSRLLASLEEADGLQSQTTDTPSTNSAWDSEFAAFYAEVEDAPGSSSATTEKGNERKNGEDEDDDDEEEEEEEDALSGTKVRAPYRTSWGVLEYHNAMVVGTEAPDGDESQVRVLYVHPTQKSMKPCPYFLEDKCRFQDDCRFSHGEVVRVSELREFMDADLGSLQEGSSCLALHEDGIWYPARITDIDNGYFTVKFNSALLKDAVLEADGVIPPMRDEDSLSSDSSDDDDFVDGEAAFARVLDTQEEDKNPASSSTFGGWEAHTRGIGSKLMIKMGYEYGKGLGRTSEGRVEPVQAVLLPKGKSLDQCAELAELAQRRPQSKTSKDTPHGGARMKRRRAARRATRKARANDRRNVFDFLNHKLGDAGADSSEASAGTAPLPPPRAAGMDVYKGGKSTKRSLNVRVFQAAEKVAQTEKEIQRLTESLNRRSGRDAAMVSHLEEKLRAARRLLDQQKAQEISIQRENKKADTHKKMTEF